MANLQRIKDLALEKNILLSDIAAKVGISPAGMSNLLKKNSTTIETLEEIAKALGVHPGYFFDGYVEPKMQEDIPESPAIEDLKVELAAKEAIIQQLNIIVESKSKLIEKLTAKR